MPDQGLDAFRRLLKEGAAGGSAKVDALLALAQRTVYVATWTEGGEEYRTLVNGNGQSALPIFTDDDELDRAASHFGWVDEGMPRTPRRELGAREALRYVVSHNLDFLVVDIAASWRLEAEAGEIEPLLTGRAEPAGPYAGMGKVSSSVMRAVKPTPPTGQTVALESAVGRAGFPTGEKTDTDPRPSLPPSPAASRVGQPPAEPDVAPARFAASKSSAPSAPAASPPPAAPSETASQPGSRPSLPSPPPPPPPGAVGNAATDLLPPDQARLGPPDGSPSDALIDAFHEVLREYPEVEWAAYCTAAASEDDPTSPAVGLRVDAGFRKRVDDLAAALRRTSHQVEGSAMRVLLLDKPELVRTARSEALVFYPWRPR